jgi:lysozyme family protein
VILIITVIIALIFLLRKRINKLLMFDLIIAKILQHEGGYVNDPDDLGGETKYGISKRTFPNVDIKNLTRKEAIEIYRKTYYEPLKISEFTNINLALNYMDMAVNAGKKNAKEILDKANAESKTTGEDVVKIYKRLRVEYYKKVALLRNNQKFLAGWLNRVKSSNIA